MFNSYEFYMTGQENGWPFNTGDCLIEVTACAVLTVHGNRIETIYLWINDSYLDLGFLYKKQNE